MSSILEFFGQHGLLAIEALFWIGVGLATVVKLVMPGRPGPSAGPPAD